MKMTNYFSIKFQIDILVFSILSTGNSGELSSRTSSKGAVLLRSLREINSFKPKVITGAFIVVTCLIIVFLSPNFSKALKVLWFPLTVFDLSCQFSSVARSGNFSITLTVQPHLQERACARVPPITLAPISRTSSLIWGIYSDFYIIIYFYFGKICFFQILN